MFCHFFFSFEKSYSKLYAFSANKMSNAIVQRPSISERKLKIIQLENAVRSQLYTLVARHEKRRRTSRSGIDYWQYFREIYDNNDNIILDYIACEKCSEIIYYRSADGTAPMQRHLDKHSTSGQSNTMDQFVRKPVKNFSSFDREKSKLMSTDFVIKDVRPFEAIAGNGLIALLMFFSQLGHKYGPLSYEDVVEILPSPQTISRNVEKLGNDCRQKIKEELISTWKGGMSMTTDLWNDGYRRVAYLYITAHYFVEIGNKLIYRSRIVSLRPMDSKKRKTHDVLLNVINEEIEKLGLTQNRQSITFVSDRGSNIVAALKDQFKRYNCQAHLINNIVKQFYEGKQASKILKILKPIVRYVKINGYNEQFENGKKIKSYSKTRWNSAYYMLASILKSWNQLEDLLKTNKSNHYQKFKSIDKKEVADMIDFLEPFKDMSNELEKSSVTIFNVLPCILKIKATIKLNSNDSSIIKQMKRKGITYFNKRNKLEDIYYLSTMLFPPLNNLQSCDETIRQEGLQLLRTKFNEMSQGNGQNQTQQTTQPTGNRNYRLLSEATQNVDNRDELERYLALTVPLTENFDVLDWWQTHKNTFPVLYQLMIQIFMVPASSAQSEREFSRAGNVVTDKRSSLQPKKVEQIM